MVPDRTARWLIALRITGIYVVLGALYVLGLDYLLIALNLEREAILFWQSIKGGAFVLLTGLFLFASLVYVLRERAQRDAEIQAERERLYQVLETIPAYVYIQGKDYNVRYANKRFRELFGEIDQGPCYKMIQGRESPCPVCPTFDAFEKNAPQIWEHYDPHRNSYYEIHDTRIRDASGEDMVLEMGFDITHHKKTEATLRQLSVVVEQSPVSVVITDAHGRIEYVNPSFEKVTGYALREVLGENPRILSSGLHDPEFYKLMWDTLNSGEIWRGEMCNKRKDGSLYYENAIISPIRSSKGRLTHFIALKEDNSELQAAKSRQIELERQYRQAQKLEALGTLAGGIAHDFNNILSAILGYSELALSGLPENAPLYDDLQQIHGAGIRARDLVRQILTFSRAGEQERHPVRVDLIAKEALKLIRSSLPATIEIQQHLGGSECMVLADPSQVHQVFMNLCTNAYQAMGEQGGQLTVVVQPKEITTKQAKRLALSAGPYLEITVSDTGCGIPDGMRERIFDPFFTTKELGKGTGLGLSTVHGILKAHGGGIELTTAENQGTTFYLYLPRMLELETQSAPTDKPLRGGHETLLLVDDEEAVVRALERRLALLGYKVVISKNGVEALRIFVENPGDIDLVIADQQLEDQTGAALATKLHTIRPQLPIIAVTGHSDEVTAETAHRLGFSGFLLKPTSIAELAHTVRSVLDHAQVQT